MIPQEHQGEQYRLFMSKLTEALQCKSYLEIGVSSGELLSTITADHAVGVDPSFILNKNVAFGKARLDLFQMTSDDFFSRHHAYIKEIRPNISFLDGLHLFEFLLRDFVNAEAVAAPDGLILLHDCLPLTREMALRDVQEALQLGEATRFPNHWTGDVWKVVTILRQHRPDLKITAIDCAPTGLICVSNLDTKSNVLRKNMPSIVDQYMAVPNDEKTISAFYDTLNIEKAASLIDGDRFLMNLAC